MYFKEYENLTTEEISNKIKRCGGTPYHYWASLRGPDNPSMGQYKPFFQCFLRGYNTYANGIEAFRAAIWGGVTPEPISTHTLHSHYITHCRMGLEEVRLLGGEVSSICSELLAFIVGSNYNDVRKGILEIIGDYNENI